VEIDAVGEPGIAGGVGGGQIVDDDRRAIGSDNALPYDQRALLTVAAQRKRTSIVPGRPL
jgi:hypothetical protein